MTIDSTSVERALDDIVDPCSSAIGEPLGLHEMGLAHHIDIDEDARSVDVTLRLTSPCCAYGPTLALAATDRLERLDGVRRARVTIDHGAVWSAADMTPTAVTRLEVRRTTTRRVTGVQPYDWTARNEPEGAST